MKLYHTRQGPLLEVEAHFYLLEKSWDELMVQPALFEMMEASVRERKPVGSPVRLLQQDLLPPIGSQEVWASGVTYFQSRQARMEESKDAGGGDFYDKVYRAERPELFFKSPSYRVAGHRDAVRIRRDASWSVPEPELTLMIQPNKKIIGYTIGNDMSSRDIEGENPLYLPQAKCYDGSTAIGPCLYLTNEPLPRETAIQMEIQRDGKAVFSGQTRVSQIKRRFAELVEFLFRETSFPRGCLLMTGTGIVPPDNFSLQKGDEIFISIDALGTLENRVT